MAIVIPSITFDLTVSTVIHNKTGSLEYNYQNLYNVIGLDNQLKEFKVNNNLFKLDLTAPIDIETQPAYDGSVNLIINDDLNKPKLINTRFVVEEDNTFRVADRNGDLDTNLYSEKNFEIETSLLKVVQKIPALKFIGLSTGGNLPVGNYTFYFKYADADGNESDFVSESGKVVCHIGTINDPSSIRGGMAMENSQKVVKFQLQNIDLSYPFIKVYYTKETEIEGQVILKAFVIDDKFKVQGNTTDIVVTGFELFTEIAPEEINMSYQVISAAKTQAQTQNMLFLGNVTSNYDVFEELKDLSLRITPRISMEQNIGNLGNDYEERSQKSTDFGYEYYNTKNIYYRLGYWDEEIYRLGIVYILNDYSLSPVFNIRGCHELSELTDPFTTLPTIDGIAAKYIKVNDDYSIEGFPTENAKGTFRINLDATGSKGVFYGNDSIKPIGIGINIPQDVLDDQTVHSDIVIRQGLKSLTKGFFLVRQNRIPSIIGQALSIAKTKFGNLPLLYAGSKYKIESFLTPDSDSPSKNILSAGTFLDLELASIKRQAALCPDACVRTSLLNNFFNSSAYKLVYAKQQPSKGFTKQNSRFVFTDGIYKADSRPSIINKVSLIEPGIDLIMNGTDYFSSKAGDPLNASKTEDVLNGSFSDSEKTAGELTKSSYLVRGVFNTYLGLTPVHPINDVLAEDCRYINIYNEDYDFETNWKQYFKLRYDDSSSYYAISDRYDWSKFIAESTLATQYKSIGFYRGDCYICTYTHRMNWNFIDPTLPANTKILDKYTWHKNYQVKETHYKELTLDSGTVNDQYESVKAGTAGIDFTYKRLIPIYTVNEDGVPIEPTGKKFKVNVEKYGTFGTSKINTPDVNAVPLGHWVTFKICSNVNLSMRDVDSNYPEEEALHGKKRGFYPYQKSLNRFDSLPESTILNKGLSKPVSDKYYFEMPELQYIKTRFFNRICYSDLFVNDLFKNGYQVFRKGNYQDYTMNYGAIVKIVDWFGKLISVMENGVIMIPVNERALMANASGENVYINTENVLPKNPKVLSETFGSVWKDSIIKTPKAVYGIDTQAKRIWRTNGETFETISDLKVQKFLNDNINLKESDKSPVVGFRNIKSHYNAYKHDIIFTFISEQNEWSLCYNEILDEFTTQYSWFPGFSENINNIFYTFDNNMIKNSIFSEGFSLKMYGFSNDADLRLIDGMPFLKDDQKNRIWKHGFAGIIDNQSLIYPTKWYNVQENFSFEFVVIGVPGVQKIFNNLKIISNRAEPESFTYEISGDGYEWSPLKEDVYPLIAETSSEGVLNANYKDFLTGSAIKKLPYFNKVISSIEKDYRTGEYLVQYTQQGKDMLHGVDSNNRKWGRLRGNMQYVEDSWDVQIQPLAFKYAYLKNGNLEKTASTEMRIRDKYLKVKVTYSGTNLAVITAIKTLFTISYA